MKNHIPNILIACDNTLATLGLKHLITEIKTAVVITVVHTEKELLSQLKENSFENVFINESLYLKNRADLYHILQQKKTSWFVLGNNSKNSEIVLNVGAPEQEITHFLKNALNQTTTPKSNNNKLSEREQEILKCVAKGMTNKEISEQLFISLHTVITHRKNITSKLEIKTIPGLTIYAILNKLIDANDVNL